MISKRILFVAITLIGLNLASCDKADPIIPNEEELITTLTVTMSPIGGGGDVILSFQDLDGDGGDTAIYTGSALTANTTYTTALTLLNEAETPSEDITQEIVEEADEHQFFFESDITGFSVSYNDVDTNGFPVGVNTTVVTGQSGQGNLTITLKHQPDKAATGVSVGDITNAGGETDIAVTFDVDVQI